MDDQRQPLQLIVCDNDGCLLPEEPGAMSCDLLEPIAAHNRRAAKSNGVVPSLTVATGRPCPFVELLLRLIHCLDLPAICEHGAITYSLCENHPRFAPDITPDDLALISEFRAVVSDAHPDWIFEAGKHGTASVYVPEGEPEIEERYQYIAHLVNERNWPLKIARSVTYVNATLPHVSKATALARLFDQRKIDPARVLAIGDTDGDLVMRDLCGYFACPANATDSVKARADYVSPHRVTAGVIDILNHFVDANKCDA